LFANCTVYNLYGPTEAAVDVTAMSGTRLLRIDHAAGGSAAYTGGGPKRCVRGC